MGKMARGGPNLFSRPLQVGGHLRFLLLKTSCYYLGLTNGFIVTYLFVLHAGPNLYWNWEPFHYFGYEER